MFTGLIEEVGTVATVQPNSNGSRLAVCAQKVLENLRIGDSIAVDGVCTTVISFDKASFTIEASPETLRRTTFNRLRPKNSVNLERPLTPDSRIGGHYVTGHVDGLAKLIAKAPEGISSVFWFEVESDALAQYLVPKGSVAVSGISLTVNAVEGRRFSVAIIPHTLTHTNLGDLAPGESINVETDLLGKYVKRFLAPASTESGKPPLDEAFLIQHGFASAISQGERYDKQ